MSKRKQIHGEEEEEQSNYYIRKHVENPDGNKKRKQTQGEQEEEEEEQSIVDIGDVVDLSDLLFTDTRDYLIKYKDNQRVKDKQLAGKVVVLLFVSLVSGHKYWKSCCRDLLDIYHKLEPKACFEVIFVAVKVRDSSLTYSASRDRFQECFSQMPWTAIPFSDFKSRKRLQTKFGVFSHYVVDSDLEPALFVIDPRGVVVQYDADPVFSRYGAAGFPFNNQRLECIDSQDNVAGMQLSVKTLLASPERDYVITNKGEQVPIHKLEDKVVGFFFFTDLLSKCITRKLKVAYEELSKNVKNFEVVLINLLPISSDESEIALWKTFEAMPWLAIPFKDTDCSKKLLRIFEDVICDHGPDPISKLVIIGPHGKFVEPFGAHIMMRYGIAAYPFTRSSAVNLEIKSAKNVKPEMLWNLDSVFRQQNGSQVRFSRIVGKRIIVLFQDYHRFTSDKLKALYIQMKGTNDEFEVIQIDEAGEFECVAAGVPWLMHPPFDRASDAGQVIARFFGSRHTGLVAFDCDGTLVRMTLSPAIGNMVFPFYKYDGMEDEVLELVQDTLGEPLEALLRCW